MTRGNVEIWEWLIWNYIIEIYFYFIGSAANTPSSPSTQSNSSKKLYLNSSQTQDSNTLSEEEVQELSNVLENLKTLAAEVNRGQVNQMERIAALVENTENTRLKIKNDEKDLKKQA